MKLVLEILSIRSPKSHRRVLHVKSGLVIFIDQPNRYMYQTLDDVIINTFNLIKSLLNRRLTTLFGEMA